jgi:methyl-accepting chemotaxis protein
MKLRTKLFLMILSTSLIGIILVSSISLYFLSNNSEEHASEIAGEKALNAQVQINDLIAKHFESLKLLAQVKEIRTMDILGSKRILVDTLKVNPDLKVALDATKGQQLVKGNNDVLTNINDREFFQAALKGQEEVISDVLIAKATGHLVVIIATPVKDMTNGNIVGVLQANIELTQVSEFVTNLSKGGSTVYVVGKDGKVIAHPNADYVTNQQDLSQQSYIANGLKDSNSTVVTTNENGQKVLFSSIIDEKTGWLICVETPYNAAMAASKHLMYILLGVIALIIVIVLVLGFFVSRSFTRPLVELSGVAHKIAAGNLSEVNLKINSKDELGVLAQDIQTMRLSLAALIKKVQELAAKIFSDSELLVTTADQTTQSLSQVVTTITQLAEGNSTQANMLQQTNSAIINVTSLIEETTQNTMDGAGKAKESLNVATNGQEVVALQGQKIAENNEISEEVASSVGELVEMTAKIRNIIDAINSIAEQTNLLALNASIEAARAGEHGRGFAVVAEEIRKLAEQSSASTKEIETIVQSINGKVNITVDKLKDAKSIVKELQDIGDQTKVSFDQILLSVTGVVDMTDQIAVALNQVNRQIKEVEGHSSNISGVIQEASAGMEEVSASSEEQLASMETIAQNTNSLSNIAHELTNEVSKFKF